MPPVIRPVLLIDLVLAVAQQVAVAETKSRLWKQIQADLTSGEGVGGRSPSR